MRVTRQRGKECSISAAAAISSLMLWASLRPAEDSGPYLGGLSLVGSCTRRVSVRRARSDAPYLRGFTLVELMVVITIIAIVSSVMVMEMGGTFEDALLRTNARKLIDVCDSASNRAIAVGHAQILQIDTKTGKFVVHAKAQDLEERDETVTEGELDIRVVW